MIPAGMLRTKMELKRKSQTLDALGQGAEGSPTLVASVMGHVERATTEDSPFIAGLSAEDLLEVTISWVPDIRMGDFVIVYDSPSGSEIGTTYQVQRIEDDRRRHARVRLALTRAEEGTT